MATIRIARLALEVPGQQARPVADVSAGTWTPSSGSDLYAMLDETAASDSDLIVSAGSGQETCEVRVIGANRPLTGACRLKIRAKRG